jgi:hypothetical protein
VLEQAAGSREATLGKGARSMSTDTHEVEHLHPCYWSSKPSARRTTAARGTAPSCGADFRSTAAGKPCTEGFPLQRPYPSPLWSKSRLYFPTQPLLSSVLPTIENIASCAALGFPPQAHPPHRRPHGDANHKGRVRWILYGSTDAGNRWQPTGTSKTQREERLTATTCGYGFLPPAPKGGENLWHEEGYGGLWLLSWTTVCANRLGAFDDLSEGVFARFLSQTPARHELHMSIGKACPTRPTHAY